MLRRAEKRQSEKLTDEDSDEEWAGTISVGTPAQKFLIDFDSMSFGLLCAAIADYQSHSWLL
jgi:cathepsin D